MKWQLSWLFLFTLSCSHEPVMRAPAMEEAFRPGPVSPEHSLVQVFPASSGLGTFKYNFYVQLRNEKGLRVDGDPEKIKLMTIRGEELPLEWKRLSVGRYYFILESGEAFSAKPMKLYLGEKILKEDIRLVNRQPSQKFTSVEVTQRKKGKLILRLRLADDKNAAIDMNSDPDIILEGFGEIKDMQHIHKGIWEFSLVYGEFNQILYLSIRAQDTYISNIFRYQHIEK